MAHFLFRFGKKLKNIRDAAAGCPRPIAARKKAWYTVHRRRGGRRCVPQQERGSYVIVCTRHRGRGPAAFPIFLQPAVPRVRLYRGRRVPVARVFQQRGGVCRRHGRAARRLSRRGAVLHVPGRRRGPAGGARRDRGGCAGAGLPLRYCAVPELGVEALKARYGARAVCTPHRDWADYLYNLQDLQTFPGKRFHGQRNHLNRLKRRTRAAGTCP